MSKARPATFIRGELDRPLTPSAQTWPHPAPDDADARPSVSCLRPGPRGEITPHPPRSTDTPTPAAVARDFSKG
ncbi:MAG: hypothetical protein HYS20_01475 [Rhodocyclales bacterium]|nr:hypothetical protein [Rhodocyclales bacterium]